MKWSNNNNTNTETKLNVQYETQSKLNAEIAEMKPPKKKRKLHLLSPLEQKKDKVRFSFIIMLAFISICSWTKRWRKYQGMWF